MTTTRYYSDVGSTSTPPTPPIDWRGSWSSLPPSGSTDNERRRLLRTTPAGANVAGATGQKATLPTLAAGLQFRTPGLPAARRVKGSWRAVGAFAFIGSGAFRAHVWLAAADGTHRADLSTVTTDPIPSSSTVTTRTIAGVLAAVDAQAGDFIVVEIGAVMYSGLGGSATVWPASSGSASSTGDYEFTNGAPINSALRPWVEITLDDPLLPPADLHVAASSPTSLEVDWSAPATGPVPTSYDVRFDGGAIENVDASVAGPDTTVSFYDLVPARDYLVEVRSVTDTETSAWTSIVARTADPAPRPDPDRRWWTERLAYAAGLHPRDAQPVVQVRVWNGSSYVVDDTLSRALQSYQVTYGRKDPTARVEPVTASLVWATPKLTATPEVATRLQVALSPAFCAAIGLDPVDGIRFTGEVTDPSVAHARRLTSSACVGRLGRANRMPVDGTAWPVEDDGDRASRILAAAGIALQVGTIDPGYVAVAAPDRLETVATLLEQTAVSSLGQVVEQPSGSIDWHDADHRRTPPPAVVLPAAAVLRDVTWTQRLASLVNDVDVKTSTGTTVTVTDPESTDPNRYGTWPASVDTILTNTTDAGSLGIDIVGRRSDPSWILPDLTVDLVRTIGIDQLAGVLQLRHGSLLELTGLPAAFPVPRGRLFVEGYVETATPRTWSLTASVSDPLQSGVGIRWIDWPDTDDYQWQDLDPDLTWLDLARIYDPADTL